MTTAEQQLRQINSEGYWVTPNLGDLGATIDGLAQSMTKLRRAGAWSGKSADAANALFEDLSKMYLLAVDAIAEVRPILDRANDALAEAVSEVDRLPSSLIPPAAFAAIKDAAARGEEYVRPFGSGPKFLVHEAFNGLSGFLGGNRDAAAQRAVQRLHIDLSSVATKLTAPTADLKRVADWTWDEIVDDDTIPDPPLGWPLPPSPTPVHHLSDPPVPDYADGTNPTDPNPTRRTPPGFGSPYPSTYGPRNSPLYPGGPPGYRTDDTNPYPYSYPYRTPSVDGDTHGTMPGDGGGGSGGGFGSGGIGGSGNYGRTAGMIGGTAVAGAAALRFGVGSGAGMGGLGIARGGPGAGGLLGGGAGSASGGGAGGAGAGGAGAGSGGAGSAGAGGAGAGGRGGMMGGGAPGGAGGKKEKRGGLGGPIAPKIDDDENEFVPLPDGARAGGRETRTPNPFPNGDS